MFWIGLTGPLACGKSTVAELLQSKPHVGLIDADQLVHDLLASHELVLNQIKDAFGLSVFDFWPEQVFSQSKTPILNRKKLAQTVFSDRENKTKLEMIIHPLVQDLVRSHRKEAQENGVLYLFYDVPLLFEKQMENEFDLILLVACFSETQKKRAALRSGLNEEELELRMKYQKTLPEKISKSHYIIWNEGSFEQLKTNVDHFYQWMLKRLPSS